MLQLCHACSTCSGFGARGKKAKSLGKLWVYAGLNLKLFVVNEPYLSKHRATSGEVD